MSEVIAAFELENLRGEQVAFPGNSDALVCFCLLYTSPSPRD